MLYIVGVTEKNDIFIVTSKKKNYKHLGKNVYVPVDYDFLKYVLGNYLRDCLVFFHLTSKLIQQNHIKNYNVRIKIFFLYNMQIKFENIIFKNFVTKPFE